MNENKLNPKIKIQSNLDDLSLNIDEFAMKIKQSDIESQSPKFIVRSLKSENKNNALFQYETSSLQSTK